MNRAVFLDRDGTINEEVGYVDDLSRFRLFPYSGEAIRRLRDAGFRVVVVSNQSGVARGRFPLSRVEEIHSRMIRELESAGAHLDAIYFCPHHPEGQVEQYRRVCDCRKPRPGMLLRAAREFGLDLRTCFVVGDKYLDVTTAHAVSARGILVMSGYGRGEVLEGRERWPRPPDYIAGDLAEAAEWILRQTPARDSDLDQFHAGNATQNS